MQQRFGFLLFNGFEDLDFAGPWEMLALWSEQFNGPQDLILISETGNAVTSSKGLTIAVNTSIECCNQLDYLLIPGGQGTRTEVHNQKLIQFINKQYPHLKAMLSVCTGAFLLQAAGLLHNKKATTHWASLERLAAFTDIDVALERFIQDGNIWSSAGVSAGIDMSLAFIAFIAGEETAADVQLAAEYYPSDKIYHKPSNKLPAYVVKKA